MWDLISALFRLLRFLATGSLTWIRPGVTSINFPQFDHLRRSMADGQWLMIQWNPLSLSSLSSFLPIFSFTFFLLNLFFFSFLFSLKSTDLLSTFSLTYLLFDFLPALSSSFSLQFPCLLFIIIHSRPFSHGDRILIKVNRRLVSFLFLVSLRFLVPRCSCYFELMQGLSSFKSWI